MSPVFELATWKKEELLKLGRCVITSRGYLGIELATSTIDQFAFPGLAIVGRGFLGDEKKITVQLTDQAGQPMVTFYQQTKFKLTPQQITRLPIKQEAIKTLKDGNYLLQVEWDQGKHKLQMPFTVLGELIQISSQQREKILAYQKKLPGKEQETIRDDFTYLAEYIHHVLTLLKYRSGQNPPEEQLKAAQKYFWKNGQYKNTPAEKFAQDLKNIIQQSNQMINNLDQGIPPYQGLTGVLRRAFYSQGTGKLEPYQFYLPSTYFQSKEKFPLILQLAGNENMFQDTDKGVSTELLEEKGYIMVAPKANSGYHGAGQKDLVQLINLMLQEYSKIDRQRIYCTGASAGGFGSYDLAVEHPELIAGIACVNGSVWKKPMKGVSHGRSRFLNRQKQRGQRRGHGSRKGRKGARQPTKNLWIRKVRSQRRYIQGLRDNNLIQPSQYRMLYAKVKGNSYRNVAHLRNTIEDMGILKKTKKRRR